MFPDRQPAPQSSTRDLIAFARATAEVSDRDPRFKAERRPKLIGRFSR